MHNDALTKQRVNLEDLLSALKGLQAQSEIFNSHSNMKWHSHTINGTWRPYAINSVKEIATLFGKQDIIDDLKRCLDTWTESEKNGLYTEEEERKEHDREMMLTLDEFLERCGTGMVGLLRDMHARLLVRLAAESQ